MLNKKDLLDFLNIIKGFGGEISERDNNIIIGLYPLVIILEKSDDDSYFLFMKYRISSWSIPEDRTSFHDLIPALFTVLLRAITETNFFIINEPNDFSGIESEIYSTYIIPSQPNGSKFDLNNDVSYTSLRKFIVGSIMARNNLHTIIAENPNNPCDVHFSNSKILEFSLKLDNSLSKFDYFDEKSDSIYCSESTNPQFLYYRNMDFGVSVVQSIEAVNNLKKVYDTFYKEQQIMSSVNGDLIIAKNIKNVVSYKQLGIAKTILKDLENYDANMVFPFDNFCILLGKENLIIFDNNGDYNNFLEEKSLLRERHLKEVDILFDELPIIWDITKNSDTAIFEDMILELLEKESGILNVKKVAPTNQPDNGRDLIATYTDLYTNSHSTQIINELNLIQKKMIVQCKTNSTHSQRQSIGKSHVDIANTLLDYEPNGYLLVVNTQITRDMTEYLEKLQERNKYDINWWNKNDIEKRLRENPEIMNRYKSIVSYK